MDYKECYVYKSGRNDSSRQRKPNSNTPDASSSLRRRICTTLWNLQQQSFNEVFRDSNIEILRQLNDFLISSVRKDHGLKLPCGLIVNGSGSTSHSALFSQIEKTATFEQNAVVVSLTASEGSNLKSLVKTLISKTTSQNGGPDTEDEAGPSRGKGPRLLNYDLQILGNWCDARDVNNVLVVFNDSEAFDATAISEMLILLHSWLDRISFIVLFEIATSVDIFQDRLSRAAVRCMQGQVFNVAKQEDILERIFVSATLTTTATVRLGPALSDLLLQRQADFIQSIESFTQAVKYAFMCHFYGNPLSMFLCSTARFEDVPADSFEAIRNLPSFRRYAETLLDHGEAARVRALIESDAALFEEVVSQLRTGQNRVIWTLGAIHILRSLMEKTSQKPVPRLSTLYVEALSGRLRGSVILRELLLLVRKVPSNILSDMLQCVLDTLMTMPPGEENMSPDDFRDIQDRLLALVGEFRILRAPLRSEHELRNGTLRSGVAAHKAELSKRKSQNAEQDNAYTQLLSDFHDLLESYFENTLTDFRNLFLHEVLFYDMKSPCREVFNPKPRFAIERALSSPHDYLACKCCGESEEGLSGTQPPTAVLYQLYLESGALINAFDLWSAFQAIVGDQHDDEQMTMTLYFRALAELKYLGLIKQSRRKADHLAKLAWKGL